MGGWLDPIFPTPQDRVSIQVGEPERATFEDIISAALTALGSDAPQSLRDFHAWVTSDGNRAVRNMINPMVDDQLSTYQTTYRSRVATACQAPERASFLDIIDAAIAAFAALQTPQQPPQSLTRFRAWVERTGDPRVRALVDRDLSDATRPVYRQAFDQEVYEACGYRQVYLSTITSINLTVNGQAVTGTEIQAGQTVTITLNGRHLPTAENATITILDGSGNPIAGLTPQTPSAVRTGDEVTSLTFTLIIPADAILGQRGIRVSPQAECATPGVSTEECVQISATNPNAFTIVAAPVAPVEVVAPTVPESCTDTLDNDHDGLTDADDPDCQVSGGRIAGEEDLTGADRSSYLWFDALQGRAAVEAGFGVASDRLTGEPLTPAMQETPNVGLRLQMGNIEQNRPVTIWGRTDSLASGSPTQPVEVMGDFRLRYFGNYQEGGSPAVLEASLAPQLRAGTAGGGFYVDAYGRAGVGIYSRQSPSRYYFEGVEGTAGGGIGVGSDFGSTWARGRVFGEYQRAWTEYGQGAFDSGPFSGGRDGVRAGLRLDLDFSQISDSDSPWIPDLWLSASGMPWGRVSVPEVVPGALDSNSLETARSVSVDTGLVWRRGPGLPIAPFVTFGVTDVWQGEGEHVDESWPSRLSYHGTVGVDTERFGMFTLGWGYTRNMLMFGDRVDQVGPFSLAWTLPWLNRSVTLSGQYSMIDERGAGGGTVTWDPFRAFLPNPPQPVLANRGY